MNADSVKETITELHEQKGSSKMILDSMRALLPILTALLVLAACDTLGGDDRPSPIDVRIQTRGGVGGYIMVSKELGENANAAYVHEEKVGSFESKTDGGLFLTTLHPDSSVIAWAQPGDSGEAFISVENDESGEVLGTNQTSTAHRITVRVDGGSLESTLTTIEE